MAGAGSGNDGSEVRVKKVSAYPIPVQLGAQPGQIVKLAPTGFLVETSLPLVVSQQYQSQFSLPVLHSQIQFTGVVVKTYHRFGGALGETKNNTKLAEITFKKLSPGAAEAIGDFLKKIGQAK